LDLPLLIEGQLLSQEQDFRTQRCARAEQETEEKKPVHDQIDDQPDELESGTPVCASRESCKSSRPV
jgi:hypothetical protein